MQVRALKSFTGRYGHIRVGQVFNCVPNYAAELIANGLVRDMGEPGPSADRALPGAPHRADVPPRKEAPAGKDGATDTSERAPVGGSTRTSRSLRADLASRRKTQPKSAPGATKSPDPATP